MFNSLDHSVWRAVERKSMYSWNILCFVLCQMPTKITLSSLIVSQFAHFFGWLFEELTNSAIEIFADSLIKNTVILVLWIWIWYNKRVWGQHKTNAINFVYLKNKIISIVIISVQRRWIRFVQRNVFFFYVFKLCTFAIAIESALRCILKSDV